VRAGNLFRHSSTVFWWLHSPDTYLHTYLPDRIQSCLEPAYPLNGRLCWIVLHSPLQLQAALPHELVLKRRTVLKSMHSCKKAPIRPIYSMQKVANVALSILNRLKSHLALASRPLQTRRAGRSKCTIKPSGSLASRLQMPIFLQLKTT
jgi:hypothetical protein